MKSFKQILIPMLIVCVALFTTGCKQAEKNRADITADTIIVKDGDVVGTGETQFTLEITDKDKNITSVTVNTEEKTVGKALLERDIITGEKGPYGMYIKTVNGITADFDTDKTYWAFYVNGEYALSGIDMTDIEKGVIYGLKVEK